MALTKSVIAELYEIRKYPPKIRFQKFKRVMSKMDEYNLDGDTMISAYKLCGLNDYSNRELM